MRSLPIIIDPLCLAEFDNLVDKITAQTIRDKTLNMREDIVFIVKMLLMMLFGY